MKTIDLNCDMGEIPELAANGSQAEILRWVTSINVACGGHAGSEELMELTIRAAQEAGSKRIGEYSSPISVGAHPGYPDPENFGRVAMEMTAEEIAATVERQVHRLSAVATRCGITLSHGKPHGALYNVAAGDRLVAGAIADGFGRCFPGIPLMGLAGSGMLAEFEARGFPALPEAFVDRRYEPDGALRARSFADALIRDPQEAAERAVRLVLDGTVEAWDGTAVPLHARTLCIHSDSPGAAAIAEAVRHALENAGVRVC